METITFNDFNISQTQLRAIEELGFTKPSDIQREAIPLLLEKECDFVGQAQTGTGKTAAFVLPLLEKLDRSQRHIQALVLAPTRELANQVSQEVDKLGKYSGIKSFAVYGGESYERQIRGIRQGKPQIIVGTPGRLMDLMNQGIIDFSKAKHIILDEADEMLNMGFFEDVEKIVAAFDKDRSIWMFSATMPKQILNLINRDFKSPEIVKVAKKTLSNEDIEQKYYVVKRRYQTEALCRLLDVETDVYGIVFCNTKRDTWELAEELTNRGYKAEMLHGDMGQAQRDSAMRKFKAGRVPLMVCTDVAARGIDVNNLTHVINYGLPRDLESYVHRIGRTGRAGIKGKAVALVEPNNVSMVRRLERFTKCDMVRGTLPNVDELKKGILAKELESMSKLVESVIAKGDDFNVDNTFENFKEYFELLSKDDVLKVIFSMNFNSQFKRLNEMGSLDEKPGRSRDRNGRRDRNDRRDRRDRNDRNDRSDRSRSRNDRGGNRADFADKGNRGDRSRRSNGPRVASVGNVRLFVNVGKDDGVRLPVLLDDLSKQTGIEKRKIRNVDLMHRFSFIEVPEKDSAKFLNQNLKVGKNQIRVEVSK